MRNKTISILLLLVCLSIAIAKPSPNQATQKLRIVSLGGIITETIYALGMGSSIVGVDVSSIYPAEANRIPKVGYWRGLSAEGVLSLKPNLVLATYDTGPDLALNQIRKAGVKVYKTPAKFNLETAKSNIKDIAGLIGKVNEGNEIIRALDEGYKEVQKKVARLKKKQKTIFIYFRGGKIMNLGGRGTPANDMIELAGGESLGKKVDGWKNVTSEFFITSKPDVLVVTRTGIESVGGMDRLKELPGVASTPAVKNNRIVVVDDLAFLGFGPRLNQSLNQLLDTYLKMQ